jgi:LysM repeat protein
MNQHLQGGHDLKKLITTGLILAAFLCGNLVQAQSLKGSPTSIENQYRTALAYGYPFVKSARSLNEFVRPGQLVRVNPDRYLELVDVSYPYAVPGTKLFLNRLSAQYHNACGEKLTVTSLLRPRDRQPANSVAHSVHPTGMAIDMRVPRNHKCRSWLERTLLSLEKERVLDVTRERRPPHYHVAVFAKDYETRVAGLTGSARSYAVRKGDTLSGIAASTGVGVEQLRAANGLRGNLIRVGQKLHIPATGTVASAAATSEVVAANEITHRVNRGDTLWRIANRYGTSVQQLRRANNHAGDYLQIGQVLRISEG